MSVDPTGGWTKNGIHYSRQSNYGYEGGSRVNPVPDLHVFAVLRPESPTVCKCGRLEASPVHSRLLRKVTGAQ